MMLSIAEAAVATGVSAHTLRYYERIGLLDRPGRTAGGQRCFVEADLGRIEFLTMLRATGMPIRQMQRFVELTRAGDHTVAERVEILDEHRAVVRRRRAEIEVHLAKIERKLDFYSSMLEAQPTD